VDSGGTSRRRTRAADVPHWIAVALSSAAGPVAVALAASYWAERARPGDGEAFWILPTLFLGSPASAIAGVLAVVLVERGRRRPPPIAMWLVTASLAFLPCLAIIYAELGVVTRWVGATLLAGAVIGALPMFAVTRTRGAEP
jgi:hypothetical protein